MASTDPGKPSDSADAADSAPVSAPITDNARPSYEDRGTEPEVDPEPVVALLTEMNVSMKDLKNNFGRLMKAANLSEDEIEVCERRREEGPERENEDRVSGRRIRTWRSRGPSRSGGSTSYYSDSSAKSDNGNEVVVMRESVEDADFVRSRRLRRDSRLKMSLANSQDRARYRVSSRRVETRSAQRLRHGMKSRALPGLTASDDDEVIVTEERSDRASPRRRRTSTQSNEPSRRLLKGYTTESVSYGQFPDADLCEQLFGSVSLLRQGRGAELSSWLEEQGLLFPHDERCAFAFDTAAFADDIYARTSAQMHFKNMDDFTKDLREKGGFFFFRESYISDSVYKNKVYNGTHVFRCKDRNKNALPMLSEGGTTFVGEFPKVESRMLWPDPGEIRDNPSVRRALENMIYHERVDIISNHSSGDCGSLLEEPPVTYHYKGKPKFDHTAGPPSNVVTDYGGGIEFTHNEGRNRYQDPHLTAPWRRLCVITGLSRISIGDKSMIWLNVPIFAREPAIEQGSSSTASGNSVAITDDDSDDNTGDDDKFLDLRSDTILEHLSFEQSSIFRRSRKRVVKFQLSWYELIPGEEAENRQRCGRLYRDERKRSMQLQSFMVIAIWQRVDEDFYGDSKFWTLVVMAPAFFYHQDMRDPYDDVSGKVPRKELHDLIAPLQNVLPTLSATLLMISRRILATWTEISEYVEQFIASQDTFLHEKRHDRLLFDDDSFTRSRQYFWVISSTGEFIVMIDETISHYKKVTEWVSPNNSRKHRDLQEKLEAIRDKFDRQRSRATDLREGLFSASAVVESRLSTRLAQNVKLLTYVSIFYLPLAFCAALWAIPNVTDSSTRTPFIVTAALVGFITYFIVFNLDALVSRGWDTYAGFRKMQIRQMTKETRSFPGDDKWQERARGYSRFQPDRGSTKPSEWYIFLYSLRRLFRQPLKPEKAGDGRSEVASSNSFGTSLSEEPSSGEFSSEPASINSVEVGGKTWRLWLPGWFKKSKNDVNKV